MSCSWVFNLIIRVWDLEKQASVHELVNRQVINKLYGVGLNIIEKSFL